ncbi:response regulator [Marinoscillum pacificum]|uniref:response regulator n=1 Tax=Marinoscillum pacificum TaxID=392723 RepID=UPI002157B880|nr:response regulator [Marinoscillum pacificum]
MKKSALIIDDSAYARKVIGMALNKAGYEDIVFAETGEEAIDAAIRLNPDFITLDNVLPDMLGLDILKVIKEEELKADVLIISAIGQQSAVEDGLKLGAFKYIVKPFTLDDVMAALTELATKKVQLSIQS